MRFLVTLKRKFRGQNLLADVALQRRMMLGPMLFGLLGRAKLAHAFHAQRFGHFRPIVLRMISLKVSAQCFGSHAFERTFRAAHLRSRSDDR